MDIDWLNQLPRKGRRGSRPRCVLLTDGTREAVAKRLTGLADLPDMWVSPNDAWMPRGKANSAEARLDRADRILRAEVRDALRNWWLSVVRRANTPNWDIASTCTIGGRCGLLLVEAKAHATELGEKDKCGSRHPGNRAKIGRAIGEANDALRAAVGGDWGLSRDSHYQLSNRFAWSWKLASLGVPVVLVYLGFLNAQDMACHGEVFRSRDHWERVLRDYCVSVVDEACWGRRLDFGGTPFMPLIRVVEQPFSPVV